MQLARLTIVLTLLTALFMTSCRSSRQMTTEQTRTEVVHDTLVDVRIVVVHDTVRETQTVTVVLNADSTERSRTTEKTSEHLRSTVASAEEKSVLESTVQSEERTEDKQTVIEQPKSNPIKPFLWGTLTGIVLTIAAIIFVKLRKR